MSSPPAKDAAKTFWQAFAARVCHPGRGFLRIITAMIVCVCRRVSDREIARHARAGMGFEDIQFELGVATQCGCCEGCARDVIAQCQASRPVAALRNESTPQAVPRS